MGARLADLPTQRREYDGVEFFPNPDGAAGTPGYYNYWKGFEVQPSPKW